jgi:predicted transcriptional regulator
MIVRIHMEDQYRLGDAAVAEVDKLDDALMAAMDAGDTAAFSAALHDLLVYVRTHGEQVPTDEIIPSDVILPSEDMTLADAHEIMEKPAPAPTSAPFAQTPD